MVRPHCWLAKREVDETAQGTGNPVYKQLDQQLDRQAKIIRPIAKSKQACYLLGAGPGLGGGLGP